MVDAGLIVLVAFISPFRSERMMVRRWSSPDEFIEIFVSTPSSSVNSGIQKVFTARPGR